VAWASSRPCTARSRNFAPISRARAPRRGCGRAVGCGWRRRRPACGGRWWRSEARRGPAPTIQTPGFIADDTGLVEKGPPLGRAQQQYSGSTAGRSTTVSWGCLGLHQPARARADRPRALLARRLDRGPRPLLSRGDPRADRVQDQARAGRAIERLHAAERLRGWFTAAEALGRTRACATGWLPARCPTCWRPATTTCWVAPTGTASGRR
jgi:hypothetical protein